MDRHRHAGHQVTGSERPALAAHRRKCLGLAGILILLATPISAQSLRSRFNQLFVFGDCGVPMCLAGSVETGHAGHYVPFGAESTNATTRGLLGSLQGSILTSISNIPASLGSGGATVVFVQGLPVTTPVSSGPILGERAPTLGRHRLLIGVNLTGGRFDRLRGLPLRRVELNFIHEDVGNPGLGDPSFENDVITVTPDIHLTLLATSLFATYGLTNFLDLGVVVPVIHASLRGRSVAVINCGTQCFFHFFGTPTSQQLQDTASVRGSATGLGDITLRSKLALLTRGRWTFSILAEARLPSGREADLLGEGHLGLRAQAIGSATWGAFTGHANAGYFARGGANLNDAALATVGFDVLATSWLTLAADAASQWQIGREPFSLGGTKHFDFPVPREVALSNVPNRRDDRLDGSLGIKLSNNRGLTGLANIYVPLRSAGLQAPLIWTLGAQYDF